VINAINVRDALPSAVDYLLIQGIREQTRLGEVLASPGPVCIQYLNPKEHVLFNPIRDANPFFHLMEAIWMLAGRHDGSFLDNYIKDFSKRFGNNGIIMDAYGYRWRYALRMDQLDEIVAQLRKDPTTRQAVLQMWGAGVNELMSASAKPCNLIATFRIVNNQLDMTVLNRSNDVIWGCCGANAVHFPILQEYIAARIGVNIGRYHQISTNLHLYQFHIDMITNRLGKYKLNHHYKSPHLTDLAHSLKDNYAYEPTQSLMTEPLYFDDDLKETMVLLDLLHQGKGYECAIMNIFLREVVVPMATAYRRYKDGNKAGSYEAIESVIAADWQRAGKEWLERRYVGR